MAELQSIVEMDAGLVRAIENMEANISRIGVTALWFQVDSPRETILWPSDDLNRNLVESLRVGDVIVYSAESDEDGDLIITKLRVRH